MRDDLLIGLHLALDLPRYCLVLQMIRRDRALGAAIHRHGGFGNDLVARLCTDAQSWSPGEILGLIVRSSEIFDELAATLSPAYQPRLALMQEGFQRARDELAGRADSR